MIDKLQVTFVACSTTRATVDWQRWLTWSDGRFDAAGRAATHFTVKLFDRGGLKSSKAYSAKRRGRLLAEIERDNVSLLHLWATEEESTNFITEMPLEAYMSTSDNGSLIYVVTPA